MSADTEWWIPPSVLHWLEAIPAEQPVSLLLRHSVRDPLPPNDVGYTLPITAAGLRLGRELGRKLGGRLRSLRSSPVIRCLQTAEALREGAGIDMQIVPDQMLGEPGAYVIDAPLAWTHWQSLGHEGVMQHLVTAREALPGMAPPDEAARGLVQHMLTMAAGAPGVHVFVTHDLLVTATVARMSGRALEREAWPWYLEGAFFWQERDGLRVAYRDEQCHCLDAPETKGDADGAPK